MNSKTIPEFENVKFGDGILTPSVGGDLSQRLKKGQTWPKLNSKNIPEFENVKSGDGILPPPPGGHLSQGSNSRRQRGIRKLATHTLVTLLKL